MAVPTTAGHRVVPHTADVIVESWGPSRTSCLEQAALGLVGVFAEIPDASVAEPLVVQAVAPTDDEVLVLLLEEVLYQLEVLGVVPATLALEETEGGGVAGFAHVVPVAHVEEVGAVPKAVSRHELSIGVDDAGVWRARVVIDV